MAVGDEAISVNYPIVPGTGEEGKVKWGAREINRTRDFIAQVKKTIPKNLNDYRSVLKINYGPGIPGPSDGVDGEIWFKVQ